MKNKTVAIVLALFLGHFGAHKFYLERPSQAILYTLFFWTFIPTIIAVVDIIRMLGMNEQQWADYSKSR
jgi:TM2 domain-containing membrane protein YozV